MIYKIIPADQIGRANPSSRKEETKQKISENRGKDMHYTYIVECRDKTLYTGWTTDLEKESGCTMKEKEPNIQKAGLLFVSSITNSTRQNRKP